jgi:hypothetical protein
MASADKAKVVRRRAKLYEGRLRANAIAAACDHWLRSRGLADQRENFNRWNPTEERKL